MWYRLDSDDILSDVSPDWLAFAQANGARELTRDRVLGRSLWDSIADVETRHLYGLLFERVRGGGAPIAISFRCDSPEVRRFMELSMHRIERDGIEIRASEVRTELRHPLPRPLLHSDVDDGADLVVICSWCKQVLLQEGRWVEVETAVDELGLFHARQPPQLTHGVCPACAEMIVSTLDRMPQVRGVAS